VTNKITVCDLDQPLSYGSKLMVGGELANMEAPSPTHKTMPAYYDGSCTTASNRTDTGFVPGPK
jgi:hypothetical protein